MSVTARRILMGIVGLAAMAAIVYAFLPDPVPVDTAAVSRGSMRVTVEEEGKTRIRERYVLSAPLAGRLRRIEMEPGDAVDAQNTVVAVIEPTDPQLLDARARAAAEARVRAAEAELKRAGARRESAAFDQDLAEENMGRVEGAYRRQAATEHEAEEARLLYHTAMQIHRAAQFAEEIAAFELEQARSALLHTDPDTEPGNTGGQFSIRAPISGRVLRVLQESMAVVQPGVPLLEIGDPSDLEVEIEVLSTDAVRIEPGAAVIIDHWGGEGTLLASVRLVEPSAFTKISALGVEEQRVKVIADFVSPFEQRRTLGDGYRVEGAIVLWEGEDVVSIPTSALFRHGGQWAVFVVESRRAVRRPVEIGHRTGLTTQVLSGLEPGETVVIHPSDKVDDGVTVEPRDVLG